MIWLYTDIRQWTPLCIPGKLRMINVIVVRVVHSFSWELENRISCCKVYSIATVRTLTWEGTEFGNVILNVAIQYWNQPTENSMSSSPIGCVFITSLMAKTERIETRGALSYLPRWENWYATGNLACAMIMRQLRSYMVGQREHFPATVWWKPWK